MIIFRNVTTNDNRIVFYLNIINMIDNHSAFPICYSRSLLQHFYYSSAVVALTTFYQNLLAFPQLWTFYMLIRYSYHIFILKKFWIDSNECLTLVMQADLTLTSSCTSFMQISLDYLDFRYFAYHWELKAFSQPLICFNMICHKIANFESLYCI